MPMSTNPALGRYARTTAPGYCAGCGNVCESAIRANVPISDIMRYLMYYDEYGHQLQATRLFNDLSPKTRKLLTSIDYSRAESVCPQNIPIARFMQYAVNTFTGRHQG